MQFDSYSLEQKLATTYLTQNEKDNIIDRYLSLDIDNEFDLFEVEEINKKIFESQVDPILAGWNYNQRDILRHLKKLR